MYKIVETVEKGLKQLTIVPSAWETNGRLSWPKNKADKLIKIGESVPDDNWFNFKCKLKRNHLLSYEIAEEELELMLQKSDTEQDDCLVIEDRKKRSRVVLKKGNADNDLNHVAEACMLPRKTIKPQAEIQIEEEGAFPGEIYENADQYRVLQEEPSHLLSPSQNVIYVTSGQDILANNNTMSTEVSGTLGPSLESLNKQLTTVMQKIENIEYNQNVIMQQFNSSNSEITMQLAKLETTLDTLINNFMSKNSCSCGTTNTTTQVLSPVGTIEPINTVEDMSSFNQKLSDNTIMKDFIQKMSYVCGKQGNGHGLNNCYILIDRLFTRKFMTLCSWAGGSRYQNEKVAFKSFKNVIKLFFEVIRLSDDSFTMKDAEEFLKNVIRNSTRRNESQMVRSSRIKRRQSKKPINGNESSELPSKRPVETVSEEHVEESILLDNVKD
ncbi:unnamed protein product [Callosobruchus maculatus]|uniref:DUF4806 domain-containing protein n=1 Tax=Callosobruchus maculatus TaxID=64391 RepID=A0A653CTQ0_CALMS|nr:unnamed protein product [Callosobruchus maculatus]